jgi:hypothetical protein
MTDSLEAARIASAKLTEGLPSAADLVVSQTAKTPALVVMTREGLIWRQEELARACLANVDAGNGVAATLIARAAMETTAAVVYLHHILKRVDNSGLSDTDIQDLEKLFVGSKLTDDEMPEAIQILKMIDRVNKAFAGLEFRQLYNELSETAHPNWRGVFGAYGRINQQKLIAEFASDMLGRRGRHISTATNALAVALELFILEYNALADALPRFATACEDRIESNSKM